jgi:phosphopantothenoylcysteine decarboxylase / phosphopantothenate---cysteine ligase
MRDRHVESKSSRLLSKRIAFGVCSAIGSVEVVRIVRELRRHGAEVTVFMNPDTELFVGKMSLEWASGRPVVDALTAQVDGLEAFDIVVIAPLTLNSLVKLSLGLCDGPVTMVAASQLGRRGLMLLYPTMHGSLHSHPAFDKAVHTLTEWGVQVVCASEEEGRLKMPSPEILAAAVLEHFK